MRRRKTAMFAKMNTLLVMVNYIINIVYDKAFIHFAIIGECLWGGDTNIITNSLKIGFREINIGSTHTFC